MRTTEQSTPDPMPGGGRRPSNNDAPRRAGSGAGGWLDRLGVALVVAMVLLISGAMTSFAASRTNSATPASLAQSGDCSTGGGLDHLGKISCHLDQGLTHVDTLSSKMTPINSISPKIECGLNGTSCSTSTSTTTTTPTTTSTTTTTTTPTTTSTTTTTTTTTSTTTTTTSTPPSTSSTNTTPPITPPTPPQVTPPTPPVVTVPPAAIVEVATSTAPPQAAPAPVVPQTATGTAARTAVNVALPAPPIAPSNLVSYVQPAAFPSTGDGGTATGDPWPLPLLLLIAMVSLGRIQRRHPQA